MIEISLQTQFYICYGVFAGVSVILIIWLLVLCYSVEKLRKTTRKLENQLNQENNNNKKSNFAYRNSAIQPDEELAKRGYSMYDGQFVPRLESTGPGQFGGVVNRNSSVNNREYVPLNDQIPLRERDVNQNIFNIDQNEEYLNYPEYRAKRNMQRGQQYNLNNPMAHQDGNNYLNGRMQF